MNRTFMVDQWLGATLFVGLQYGTTSRKVFSQTAWRWALMGVLLALRALKQIYFLFNGWFLKRKKRSRRSKQNILLKKEWLREYRKSNAYEWCSPNICCFMGDLNCVVWVFLYGNWFVIVVHNGGRVARRPHALSVSIIITSDVPSLALT